MLFICCLYVKITSTSVSGTIGSSPMPSRHFAHMHRQVCGGTSRCPRYAGIINRGSKKLAIIKIPRRIFLFGLVNGIALSVEWVPREENVFAEELSKLLIPDD